jgi:signal transduction histidine kinase/ligand-binding sensor domain-containing protein
MAQEGYNFYRMDVNDGLSHNNVYSLYQDSFGYIWIGTGRGLHRYDGGVFKNYYHELGNKFTIPSGYVRAITEDSFGNLWIGTEGGGISKFNNGTFKTFTKSDSNGPNHNNIEKIVQLPDSSIAIATWGGGINFYKNNKFSFLDTTNSNLSNNNVVDLLYDHESEILWIATWDGGICQLKNGEIVCSINDPSAFNSTRARSLAKTNDGSIWIGTWGSGLFQFKDGKYVKHQLRSNSQNEPGDNFILTLSAENNKLWVGTFGGGVALFENKSFTYFKHDLDDKNSISSNFIESSLVDKDGNLWIGTFGSGLTKFEKSYFKSYQYHSKNPNSISNNVVTAINSFEDSSMLVATRGSGLDVFKNNKFLPLHKLLGDKFKFSYIFCVLKASDNKYWFGGTSEAGLYTMEENKLTDLTTKFGTDLSSFYINKIIEGYDKSIWFGGEFEGGLNQIKDDQLIRFRHDPENKNSIGDNNVMSLEFSSDSTLWIGLRRFGLNTYKNGKFTRYRSDPNDPKTLSNDFIHCIKESNDGIIWIGTERGLNKFNRETEEFERFFIEDGLENDMIMSILEDDSQNLWISTHKGISKYNPRTNTFENYNIQNGILVSPFNLNSSGINPSTGEFLFGGIHGLLMFHPDSIWQLQKEPIVQITNLKLNNQEQNISQKSILKNRIENTKSIHLSRDDKLLSIEFSAMDFTFSNKNQFQYILDGFDKTWHEAGHKNYASYSNLAPGEYEFKVKSSIDGLYWSNPKSLIINVKPAWWETSFFISLAIITFIASVIGIVKWRLSYLEQQKVHLTNLVNKKTEEIQNTLIELQSTQEKLIKSEKLAALSQVVFNLLHELNSPLGSTKAGLDFIKKDVLLEIESLPRIIEQLSEQEFIIFRTFIEQILKQESNYTSTDEVRKLRDKLKSELSQMGITDIGILDSLIAIDCFEINENIIRLLKLNQAKDLIELAEAIILKYHNLRNMDHSVERSISILNSLKTYTLQNTKKVFKSVNLLETIEYAKKILNHEFRRGIKLKESYTDNPTVFANKEQLAQIWINLISNANYAMGYKGDLFIGVKSKNNFAIVTIKDSGEGIPEEISNKIYEPFFTTKPLGEGRGIGLDIVKKIISRHNGKISHLSEPGMTEFTVKIPINRE